MSTPGIGSISRQERIWLSVRAVAAGWGVFFVVLCILVGYAMLLHSWMPPANPLDLLLIGSLGSAGVVSVVWLVVALPFALLVPDDSAFWKPWVLTFVGLAAGPAGMVLGAIYQLANNPTISIKQPDEYLVSGVLFPGIPAAIVGGVTGVVAAQLHKRLRKS